MANLQIPQKHTHFAGRGEKFTHTTSWFKMITWCVLLAVLTAACLPISSLSDLVSNLSTPQPDDSDDQVDELAIAWQANIDELSALFRSQQLPPYLMEDDPVLQGDEFDIMSVFDILNRIGVLEGYRLAYVYHYDGMGGYPVLYAIEEGAQPYASLEEFRSAQPDCFEATLRPTHCDILTYLETDGSDLGYLQLLLFDEMKGQFYLYWHAAYRDTRFIATPEALDSLLTQISDPFIPLTGAQQRQVEKIDLSPQVIIGDETVEIRAVWFTKWGGFFESRYVLSKDHPHLILESEDLNLIEYDCGIMF